MMENFCPSFYIAIKNSYKPSELFIDEKVIKPQEAPTQGIPIAMAM